MTTPIALHEVRSNLVYADLRPTLLPGILVEKRARRVRLNDELELLFENRRLALYHLQEILRADGVESPEGIASRLAQANRRLGRRGELTCTLFVTSRRPPVDLPERVYAELPSGARHYARCLDDPHDARPAPVHFLALPTSCVPLRIGVRGICEVELPASCFTALRREPGVRAVA